MRLLVIAFLAVLGATGCGRERLAEPDVAQPLLTRTLTERSFPREGLRVSLPPRWSLAPGRAPLVVQSTSGTAAIAVWRYPRTEPLPTKAVELEAAQEALLRAVRQRDDRYREISTRRTEVDGEPAIELLGVQSVAGRPRRVRSTHVYAHGGEIVIDQYATLQDFPRLDAALFEPVVETLRIRPPR